MKPFLRTALLATTLLPMSLLAQPVDRTKYPDYSTKLNPDYSVMRPNRMARAAATRPSHVNNAETKYFPPVFNQSGGSCGSASRICYMFSHELNSYRDLDGKDPHNYYPSHFVWLLTNGNSGKDEFIQYVGVPSAATYGGQTYSDLFGNQDTSNDDFGWMTGYDKWYSAMFNRMLRPTHFPADVGTEAGREALKNWLWNHNGDPDFHSGGIVGIGVASGGNWQKIPSTPTNDEIGVTGMGYVKAWGTQVDHALTVVGYDDRIEFDLNNNGKYGEAAANEKGAWIVVNSWGAGWQNGGFIYCPYAYAGPVSNADGSFPGGYWNPEIYHVRKNYRPLRTIKLKMDYSRRSELYLSAGVSDDLNATEPKVSQAFDHFKYAGDGNYGNSSPAPAVPMLGRWADGKLHDEPMEFGYDLTDLSANLDQNMPLKYFFVIQTKNGAIGSGKVYDASIIDYMEDEYGIETPFEATQVGDVEIKNSGNRTLISMVVQGRGVYAPRNARIVADTLSWNAPVKSARTLTGYKVYFGSEVLATLGADATQFVLPSTERNTYRLTALYDAVESSPVSVDAPLTGKLNYHVNVQKDGFVIPTVFGSKYDKATIEYWVKCNSISNWNQSIGPGWGTFMMHANSGGTLTAGWDLNNRFDVASAFSMSAWQHIALVVDGNVMTVYVNGVKKGSKTSDAYSGLGGFGDLTFNNTNNGSQDAHYDEIRIWSTARTAEEISKNRATEFGDASLPSTLLAYYKGDLINDGGVMKLRDHTAAGRHAAFYGSNYKEMPTGSPNLGNAKVYTLDINAPAAPVYVGMPVTLTADVSLAAQTLKWTVADAGMDGVDIPSPTVAFRTVGKQQVIAVATNKDGSKTWADTLDIDVLASPAPDASFTATSTTVAAGERISFHAKNPQIGYLYEWSMPGADKESATTAAAGATYQRQGAYPVTLTITTPDGKQASSKQTITVSQVAPQAAFTVYPGVVIKGEPVKFTDASKFGPESWEWQVMKKGYAMVGHGEELPFVTTKPGIYDVKLTVKNGAGMSQATQEGALVVCNADSKNGLSFNYDAAQVTVQNAPFEAGQKNFTIDWWMRPNQLSSPSNGIGESAANIYLTTSADGSMQVQLAGKSTVKSSAGYVLPNAWHHYAVALQNGSVRFYRDGEFVESKSSGVTSLVVPSAFAIGSAEAPFNGQIDEFRVWSTALTLSKVRSYITEPLEGEALESAKSQDGLQLYYQFNQSGGDVVDATGNGHTGVRSGFGPDGDAWGLSRGVFSITFDEAAADVTATYLKNYKEPFASTGVVYNPANTASRFMTLADWTRENESNEYNPTGAHVDNNKNKDLTITTSWDGFDDQLTDHKVYQTVTLPAGAYLFTANYGSFEGQAGNSFLAVAAGSTLPTTASLPADALAYTPLVAKSASTTSNSVFFMLTEPTEVSLGLVVNMSGKQCLSFASFNLSRYDVESIVPLPEGIDQVVVPSTGKPAAIYDLSGRRVFAPQKGQIYIIGNQKVIIR